MYRIIVRNMTDQALTLCETTEICSGAGRVVAATPDIVVADRLVAVTGLGALMDFSVEERRRFMVTTTEFGCVLDHPEFGRIEVTIFDPQAHELGLSVPAADESKTACN